MYFSTKQHGLGVFLTVKVIWPSSIKHHSLLPQHSVAAIGRHLGKRIEPDVLSQSEIGKFPGFIRKFPVKWTEKTFGVGEAGFCS